MGKAWIGMRIKISKKSRNIISFSLTSLMLERVPFGGPSVNSSQVDLELTLAGAYIEIK
jgi:hypothetical protein